MTSLFEKFQKMEINDKSSVQTNTKGMVASNESELIEYSYAAFTETPQQFYEKLLSQKEVLVEDFYKNGYGPLKSIEHEFDLVLDLIKNNKSIPNESTSLKGCSLFQVLVNLYPGFGTKKFSGTVRLPLKKLLEMELLKASKTTKSEKMDHPFGTLVVTEAADIHSVVDEVTKSFKNLRAPWRIQKVLVQECVKDRFLSLLQKNLPEIDAVYEMDKNLVQKFQSSVTLLTDKGVKLTQGVKGGALKATVAFGVPMNHLNEVHETPIVVVDTFRTLKEGVSLANKERGFGDFVAVWSENVTEVFEYGKGLEFSTVWVNCYGVLHQKCPFTVGGVKYDFSGSKETFFENGFFHTVTGEKTLVVRYGQTFAN